MNMNAQDIISLLATKHARDIFVPQCKDGPSWGGGPSIMDAWAMKRSWANPLTIGYEVKISRRDFLADDKWHGYLDYCNEFYFVCPSGLIDPAEVRADVGIMWATGKRVWRKRKAHRRDVEIPELFYRYILMCRTRIVSPYENEGIDGREFWQRWLADKKEKKILGYEVSRRIHEKYEADVMKVRRDQRELEARLKDFEAITKLLERAGINPESWQVTDQINAKIVGAVPRRLMDKVRDARDSLSTCLVQLGKIGAKGEHDD